MKAIILAGGSGTRLWPLSRKNYPKQFLRLNGELSLLRKTVERLLKFLPPEDVIIITNSEYKSHVMSDLDAISPVLSKGLILEPVKRNTAPAIGLAVKYCKDVLKCDESEVIFVCPSDHIIRPDESFVEYVRKAEKAAGEGCLVTFGVIPSAPETGYGYIKMKDSAEGAGVSDYFIVEEFTEKPDSETAGKYIEDGHYLWNSGMFAFSIGSLLKEMEMHAPDINKVLSATFDEAILNFSNMPDISIDYAVMEKSDNVVTIPLDLYWNDIGCWDSFFGVFKEDDKGNIKLGDVLDIDTKNTLVIGDKRLIVTVGLENLIVIETDDAVLVSKRGDSQKVKEVVDMLMFRNRQEAVEHRTIYRPWGQYTVLEEGRRYKLKRVIVNPGEKLSLQMHYHRSEHWVVVKGTARVTIGDMDKLVHENESTYIPKSTIHRLENPGKVPLEIIEVQNGEYVGEDDIKRFDDIYGRLDSLHS